MLSNNAREIHLGRKIQGYRNISVKCNILRGLPIITEKQTMKLAKLDSLLNNLAQDIQNDASLHDSTNPLKIPSTMNQVDQVVYVIMLWSTAQKKLREVQALLQEQIDVRAIVHATKSKKKKRPEKKSRRFNTVCRYFRDGKCINGEECRFRHIKYKKKLCVFWEENGICKHGKHCTFAHGSEEIKK
tara:strand:+ start:131 stop:691 length:561 start_codon:yes stop_codon:yes gene_type:complete